MRAIVRPSLVRGEILAPRSKSDMQRSCAAALLHKGTTYIVNPGKSNDDLAALDVIQKLGAAVLVEDDVIKVVSAGVNPVENEINCGESGLGIRMFTPIAATSNRSLTINGTGSLVKRPMDFFDEIFPKLGIQIQSNEGKLPLHIQGPLVPSSIEVDGSLSSQFLTGLLMAYASTESDEVTIRVNNLKSKPYIDMTLRVIKAFGMRLPIVDNYETFTFKAEDQKPAIDPMRYSVEGDWSGAAFLFVAGAISGEVRIKGMEVDSVQADKMILKAIKDSGAMLEWIDGVYKVAPAKLQSFDFDATECPDLFPPLVALASYCHGITKIKGAKRLTHKESNRALTLQDVFGKMGVQIDLDDDTMFIHGGGGLKGADVSSHHDHRIAMAAAIAALGAVGETNIEDAEAIDKSYPQFYEDIISLGAHVTLQTN